MTTFGKRDMKSNNNLSLLPYLDPVKNSSYLKTSLICEDPSILEKAASPFLIVTDSDPLARLIEARFLTDAGSELKRVFLLVQKDRYFLTRDELWPVNNQDVDDSWQRAFSFYAGGEQNSSFITLSRQIDGKGRLRPFSSLFFCKSRQLFFHPPCPRCGCGLQQCYDDDLLISSGLQPYSRSLKRYLFCSSCASSGNFDFYVYELDSFDPSTCKDRWTLIKEFSLLLENKDQTSQIPCVECPDHRECYGPSHSVLSRIVPFSFYPFFMFIFEAMSLNALDFLSLLSGATFDELEAQLHAQQETGRMNCANVLQQGLQGTVPLLFDRGERHFLEVFYLKLSFLGELIQGIFAGGGLYKHPDLRLSMDRIWVKLANHGSLLPFFWNFKIKLLDIGRNLHETQSFPKLSETSGLHFLGRVWFYTLLVNKKQGISMAYQSLGEVLDQSFPGEESSFETFLKNGCHPVFLPENIFWNPEGKVVGKKWHPVWEKALTLGWSLVVDGLNKDTQWSGETFLQQLEGLRTEVKESLFREGPVEADRAVPGEVETIHGILMKILKKWQMGVEPVKEELAETVMLSPGDLEKKISPPLQPKGGDEDIPETVIVSSPITTQDSSRSPLRFRLKDSEVQGEESSMGEGEKLEDTKKGIQPCGEDYLAETVILRPEDLQDKEKDGNSG
jgi:hypothetical protein